MTGSNGPDQHRHAAPDAVRAAASRVTESVRHDFRQALLLGNCRAYLDARAAAVRSTWWSAAIMSVLTYAPIQAAIHGSLPGVAVACVLIMFVWSWLTYRVVSIRSHARGMALGVLTLTRGWAEFCQCGEDPHVAAARFVAQFDTSEENAK